MKAEIGGVRGELQGKIEGGKASTGEQSGVGLIKSYVEQRKQDIEERKRVRDELDNL